MTYRPLPENVHLIPENAERVFKGTIFDVYQWEQEMFDGSHQTFEMLRRPDTALVIVIDDNQIILQDEEQPGGVIQKSRLPGGRVESGESPLDGAKREVREELGHEYKNWALLEVTQPAVKIEWFVYVYVAVNKIGEMPTAHESGEKIQIKRVSFDELKSTRQYGHSEMLDGINSLDALLQKVNLK